MKCPQRGMKVDVQLKGTRLPGVVLESNYSSRGDYYETKVRIAQHSQLEDKWIISDYSEVVQSYKLRRRHTVIPGLDRMGLS